MNCRELTPEQLKTTNGCGSSHPLLIIFHVPRWIAKRFYRCCNRHDIRYQNQEDKDRADDELRDCMYYAAYKYHTGWSRLWRLQLADLMYMAVTSPPSKIAYRACGKL